jgi:drug/metabolite transporter (DMT)-like permease
VLLVVGLSAVAAFLFALAASLQQHEGHQALRGLRQRRTDVRRRVYLRGLARDLPRSRLWVAGWAVNLAGFVAQGAALYLGSIALVQVLLVLQLIFSLPLATWWARRWPARRDWLSAATICTGVIVFVIVHGGSARHGQTDRAGIALAVLVAAGAVGVLIWVSAYRPPLVEAALIAVAAGLCFATSAALMKLTAEDLVVRGIAATAADWPGYTLAVSTFAGVALGQWAYAAGSLPAAVAAATITNPVASYLIGILGFHLAPAVTPARLTGAVVAGALISTGVVGLARSDIVRT